MKGRVPFVLALVVVGFAAPARATLGGDAASVESNRQRLGATLSVHKLAWGERHQLQLPSKLRIHEYLSPSGIVYAVSWSGPRMPDLRQLLGPAFAELRPGRGHHSLHLRGRDLIVESGGHGRSFSGRAWIPSLLPAGVEVAP